MIDDAVLQLLRWRLERAEADAPPPPSARELLDRGRPWWERWPERFRTQVARLYEMPVAYGFAMVAAAERRGYPVPVLIDRAEGSEVHAQVIYFDVRGGRLRMRFALDDLRAASQPAADEGQGFETTFVGDASHEPVLVAEARPAPNNEYRLEAELPPHLEAAWIALRVTDRFPFRLILRPGGHAR